MNLPGDPNLPPGCTHRMIDEAMGDGRARCSLCDSEPVWDDTEYCLECMPDEERLAMFEQLAVQLGKQTRLWRLEGRIMDGREAAAVVRLADAMEELCR